VEFLSGSTVIGTDATAPYELQWSDGPGGRLRVAGARRRRPGRGGHVLSGGCERPRTPSADTGGSGSRASRARPSRTRGPRTGRARPDRTATGSLACHPRAAGHPRAAPSLEPPLPPRGGDPATSPIRLQWTAMAARQPRRRVLASGFEARITLDRAATVSARLTVDRAVARRLRLGAVTVGATRAKLDGGSHQLRLRIRAGARRALSPQQRVSLSLRIVAVDQATGTRYHRSSRVTLRR
jgi:hypothetical protein